MARYNKLIRDLVPENMTRAGVAHTIRQADPGEVDFYLNRKLREEVEEYLAEKDPKKKLKELGDIQEVTRKMAMSLGFTLEELEAVRAEKYRTHGGFSKMIILEES